MITDIKTTNCDHEQNVRIKKLLQRIDNGVAILSSKHIDNARNDFSNDLFVNSDFYYLTQLWEKDAILLISNTHPKYKYVIFYNEPTENERIWTGRSTTMEQIKEITKADVVLPYNEFEKKLPEFLENANNLYYTPTLDNSLDALIFKTQYRLVTSSIQPKLYPSTIHNLQNIITDLRLYKNNQELSKLKKAVEITETGFKKILGEITPGIYEYELEATLSHIYKKNGAKHAFPPIIASGVNSTILHYSQNNQELKKDSLVLIDSGASYQNYCSDVSRTFPISGKLTANQQKVYETVLAAQKSAIEAIKPGLNVPDYHKNALQKAIDFLHDSKIIDASKKEILEKSLYKPFYCHTTGHWLGLDTHDKGGYYDNNQPKIFKPGMVITAEPGLYFRPDLKDVPEAFKGIGVRIEDDILVTENGHEILTSNIPKELQDIQK